MYERSVEKTGMKILNRRSEEEFKPGCILSLKLQNFMAYSEAVFNFGSSLNMIIGPNGSGKSALLFAICIGLGWDLRLIKKENLRSLIKNGCEQGSIKITLKNYEPKENVQIHRNFTAKESFWTVDGVECDVKHVREICKRFEIKLDNLCVFLPQERVIEFARMTPEKLLFEVESVLEDKSLLEMHKELIVKDREYEDLTSNCQECESILAQKKLLVDGLEEEVRIYREYQEKSDEIVFLKKIMLYAQAYQLKQKYNRLKKEKKSTSELVNSINTELNEKLKRSEFHLKEIGEVDKTVVLCRNDVEKLKNDYNTYKNDLEHINDEIKQKILKKEMLHEAGKDRLKKIDLINDEITRLNKSQNEIELPSSNEYEKHNQEYKKVFENLNTLNSCLETDEFKLRSLKDELNSITEEINEWNVKLTSDDKLYLLEPVGSRPQKIKDDVFYCHVFLRQRSDLKDKYFECPIISCSVTDKRFSSFFEKVIDKNTLFSLTVSLFDDYKMISDVVFKKYNVPLRTVNNNKLPIPSLSMEKLKILGFDGYLSDYIVGPNKVLHMLYNTAKLHQIPVTLNQLTQEQINYLTNPPNNKIIFKKFISQNTIFIIQKSRYGSNQVFYSTEEISNQSYYFNTSSLSETIKDEINEKLLSLNKNKKYIDNSIYEHQAVYNSNKIKKDTLTFELDSYKKKTDNYNILKYKKSNLDQKIKFKNQLVKKLKSDSHVDYVVKLSLYEKKIVNFEKVKSKKIKELSLLIQNLTQKTILMNKKQLRLIQLKNQHLQMMNSIKDLEIKQKNILKTYSELKSKCDNYKKSEILEEIKELSKLQTSEEREKITSYIKLLTNDNLFTESYILDKIKSIGDELSLKNSFGEGSIDELKKNLIEIDKLTNQIITINEKLKLIELSRDNFRSLWEPKLDKIIQKISKNFKKKFKSIANDGEIELVKTDNFKDWKLKILVKFRLDSQLKALNDKFQSGGEKSISSIFFILSLNELISLPFRVIDEINQGMDSINERNAHSHLVQSACEKNLQYFLITPKLLTGLYYHKKVTIHCIFTNNFFKNKKESLINNDFMDYTSEFG